MDAAVLDAWAVLAYLRRELPAATAVRRYLRRAHTGNLKLLLTLVNLGEVYCRAHRLAGPEKAEEALDVLRELPIVFLPVKERLVFEAARVKANHPLSLADAFAVASGRIHRAPVLTGDPEILALPRSVVAVRRLAR